MIISNAARRAIVALALTIVTAAGGCAGTTADAAPGDGPTVPPVSAPTPTPPTPGLPEPAPPEPENPTTPPVSGPPPSGAAQGCVALAGLLTAVHSDSDLIAARPALVEIVNAMDDRAGPEDQVIIFQAEWDRNALSVDPDDPMLGDQWVDTVARTLQELFTACVDAGYVERPS